MRLTCLVCNITYISVAIKAAEIRALARRRNDAPGGRDRAAAPRHAWRDDGGARLEPRLRRREAHRDRPVVRVDRNAAGAGARVGRDGDRAGLRGGPPRW